MNEEREQGMIKLCGLWKNQAKDGKVYYSGGLSYSTNLLLFPNKYKEKGDKNPELILYISKKEKKKKESESTQDPDSLEVPF